MEGFGEALPPRDLHFLVVVAGFAGNDHQKERFLEGLEPSKPPCAGDCVSRINNRTYAVDALWGGLEGRWPSKILTFRLVCAAKPRIPGEKEDLRGRRSRPRTPTA